MGQLTSQNAEAGGVGGDQALEPFSNNVILASHALDAAPVGGKVNFS